MRLVQGLVTLAVVAGGVLAASFVRQAPEVLLALAAGTLALCAVLLLAALVVRGLADGERDGIAALRRAVRSAAERRSPRRIRKLLLLLGERPHLVYDLPGEDLAAVKRLIRPRRSTDLLRGLLDPSQPRSRRIGAIHVAAWTRVPGIAYRLIETLEDADARVAFAAAEALVRMESEEGCAAVLSAIGRVRIPASRLAALLERVSGERLARVLEGALADPDPVRRFWIAHLAGVAGSGSSARIVLALSLDPDPNVRANAAEALGRHPGPAARDRLHQLLRDEAWFVQAHAAKGLRRLGAGGESGAVLTELLTSPVWWVRERAADALLESGCDDEALSRLLREGPPHARAHAASLLVRRGIASRCTRRLDEAGERARWAVDEVRALVAAGAAPALPTPMLQRIALEIPNIQSLLRQSGSDAKGGTA